MIVVITVFLIVGLLFLAIVFPDTQNARVRVEDFYDFQKNVDQFRMVYADKHHSIQKKH